MSTVFIPLCNNGYYLWGTYYMLCSYELIIIIFILWLKQKKKRERETRPYCVLNFPPEIKSSKFELNLICYKLKHFNLLLSYMLSFSMF